MRKNQFTENTMTLLKPIIERLANNKWHYGFSEKQIERTYKYIVLEMPVAEIASGERVSKSAIQQSVEATMYRLFGLIAEIRNRDVKKTIFAWRGKMIIASPEALNELGIDPSKESIKNEELEQLTRRSNVSFHIVGKNRNGFNIYCITE